MIRIIGAALILFTTISIGNNIAYKYRMRPKQLQEIEVMLEMTASEINFAALPLPDLLSKTGQRFPKGAGKIFSNLNEIMKNQGFTPEDAFHKTKEALESELSLDNEDWNILENFSINLGKTDCDEQLRQIELCLSHIRINQKLATEERRKNERMWRYLGVLSGLMLVILIW